MSQEDTLPFVPSLPSRKRRLFLDADREPPTLNVLVPQSRLPIFTGRLQASEISRDWKSENFHSDKSRIVFCSSSRRMMQKAQVFSLESNTSVRNRLTHSLEVADIGRTVARHIGKRLEETGHATTEDTECMQCISENACLLHDIGNPPFGHFGEEAIKKWFAGRGTQIFKSKFSQEWLPGAAPLNDFLRFDGNPQGFRIATRLHCDRDESGLNLTCSTLLATVKYPNPPSLAGSVKFNKKLGIFSSEDERYRRACQLASIRPGQRYFLAYVMELADDICYCLSDIADSFEKGLTTSRDFKGDFGGICDEFEIDVDDVLPKGKVITHFGQQVSIKVSRQLIKEAAIQFAENLDSYLNGSANELADNLPSGVVLKCFKAYARKFIYRDREAQRIEIAGSQIVEGLLEHFGRLLEISRADFKHFIEQDEVPKGKGLDTEWRIFNQLSKRMLRVYGWAAKKAETDADEWICRARLVVDYISGLTDNYARDVYQNFMGTSL